MPHREFADILGNTLENVIALIAKTSGNTLGSIGVGHKLQVENVKYRYEFLLAQEGTKEYRYMQKRADQAQQELGEQTDQEEEQ